MTKTFPEKVERQARKLGLHESAIPDILAYADAEGIAAKLPSEKPGAKIREWLQTQKPFRGHWWPGAAAAAADTSEPLRAKEDQKERGLNPWADDPRNIDQRNGMYSANALTRQGQLVKAIGVDKASQIASSANGAKIGSTRPPRTAAQIKSKS